MENIRTDIQVTGWFLQSYTGPQSYVPTSRSKRCDSQIHLFVASSVHSTKQPFPTHAHTLIPQCLGCPWFNAKRSLLTTPGRFTIPSSYATWSTKTMVPHNKRTRVATSVLLLVMRFHPHAKEQISLSSSFSKVFERLIFNRLYEHININNILDINQYGFWPNSSTEKVSYKLRRNIKINE